MLLTYPTCPEREVTLQILYASVALSCVLNTGMNMGYSAVALPLLVDGSSDIILNQSDATLFASLTVVSQSAGSLISIGTMKFGRRVAIVFASFVACVGWVIVASSHNAPQLLCGRLITGLSMGMASAPSSVYVAEISTPRLTAALTSASSLFNALGIMLIYLLGLVIENNWRLVAIVSTIVPLMSASAAVYFLPESPRFLLERKQEEEAKKSLLRLRGLKLETPKFLQEFQELTRYSNSRSNVEMIVSNTDQQSDSTMIIAEEGNGSSSFRRFWDRLRILARALKIPEVWKPFLILNAFFIFQQFCGIYVIIAYAVDFITEMGIVQDPFVVTVVIGLVQLIGSIVLVVCGTRVGRRPAALISGVGMSVSLAVLGVHQQFFKNSYTSGVPLACILFFVATGSFGFTSLPWAMIGELYPTRFVNILGPTTTCLVGFYNFATVQLYPTLIRFDPIATIYIYDAISVAATLFIALALPETLKKTKTEIEQGFNGST
ncbi:facilitated trehalose transporter Tret1 isoform X2 [Orussus abietinus]|uniref:facilitated trehalose transporter Tret1 isoform X2 n=1 Tax=Orussus abietinus TaxID=222816 RepID=UPI0006261097|nr:facilitated trehalose transporter Tret1 isoform X2 [Orussus abietinus]